MYCVPTPGREGDLALVKYGNTAKYSGTLSHYTFVFLYFNEPHLPLHRKGLNPAVMKVNPCVHSLRIINKHQQNLKMYTDLHWESLRLSQCKVCKEACTYRSIFVIYFGVFALPISTGEGENPKVKAKT